MDYKATLNLPKTDFPMRANAAVREPEIQALWHGETIFAKLLERREGRPRYVLHDGPPYSSSGTIHIGHAMNKILKDIVVKHKALTGFYTPFVVGYDCHGLPTEIAALKELKGKKDLTALELRALSREFAQRSIDGQHAAFKRLGVFADWDNPYKTMDPAFEAAQIRVFGKMAEKGYIYKGLKPVYWCSTCVTALAEAEVEYEDHVSPSIFVGFPLVAAKPLADRLAAGRDVRLAIWTTTPWTLPANLAIAVHPDLEYTVVETPRGDMVVAASLVESFLAALKLPGKDVGPRFKGADLEHATYRHVFVDRQSPVVLGHHVEAESSGLVHTAPGHGMEDYIVGQAYGIQPFAPLDDRGRFTAEAPDWLAGKFYAEANPVIVAALEDRGALLANETISHSYAHCWRCHKPVIFRATDQWFASVAGFRDQALAEIEKVRWHPANGQVRITNMVADRSDWCISRQRSWGVPIPVFYCEGCNTICITPETTEHVAALFEKEGSDAWWKYPARDLLPAGTTCKGCGHGSFRKEKDIMDVWFDSGVTHEAVCAARGLGWPVDLYLEGSDQYRGWFQSSLLTAVATRGAAPYRMVVTHGFALDEQRRKMSKSLGNVVDPLEVIGNLGADVLRLWVSSQDYTSDVSISKQMLQQLAEVYRKIRNTSRFLLGNLYDFDPARDAVPYEDLPEIDRYALHRLQEVIREVREDFETFHYDPFFHLVQNYCVNDLSGFYLDVTKDRLYASAPASRPRRAAQTVLYHILHALMRLISPVLSHLAEDIYHYLPASHRGPEPSVFLLEFPEVRDAWLDDALAARWQGLLALRAEVNKLLEEARQRKEIGSSSDAAARVPDCGVPAEILREALNVSQVEIGAPAIAVGGAPGEKCQRCWLILPTVGADGRHEDLCERCVGVVSALVS
ncbi:MAG: isoleucine--tRNA ligase [Candidatus Sericytochromatia bacterium]|nr:isoleucine--tRNA ligase [Candidatus Tanganyikabacteria bacterium]